MTTERVRAMLSSMQGLTFTYEEGEEIIQAVRDRVSMPRETMEMSSYSGYISVPKAVERLIPDPEKVAESITTILHERPEPRARKFG